LFCAFLFVWQDFRRHGEYIPNKIVLVNCCGCRCRARTYFLKKKNGRPSLLGLAVSCLRSGQEGAANRTKYNSICCG
jgi:hypothetical protein